MSIPVALADLPASIARYRFAYLLTTAGEGAPHVVAVRVQSREGRLFVSDVGRRTRQNAMARPDVALVWPPLADTEFSLIVDGVATFEGSTLSITPKRATLHRPVPAPASSTGP